MIGALVGHLRNMKMISQLWGGLYLFKLFCGLLVMFPFFLITNGITSTREFAMPLMSHWDTSVITELFSNHPDIMPYFMVSLVSGVILYVIVMQFFNGGIFFLTVSGELKDIDWGRFYAECGRGFRFQLFVTVLMIPVYLLLAITANVFAGIIGSFIPDTVGSGALAVMFLKLGIIGFIVLLTSVFSDSARSAAAAYPDKSFREIVRIAADFYRERFFGIGIVFIITFIPFILIWLAVEGAALAVIGTGLGVAAIVLEFLLFQVSSIARTGQKLWYLLYFGKEFRSKYHGRFVPRQAELKLD